MEKEAEKAKYEIFRVAVESKEKDAVCRSYQAKIKSLGFDTEIRIADVYTISYGFSEEEIKSIADSLHNPTFQEVRINEPKSTEDFDFDFALELGFLPGVTDNVANTTTEMIDDLLNIKIGLSKVFTTKVLFIKAKTQKITEDNVKEMAENLINVLIERYHIKSKQKYENDGGMDPIIPIVKITEEPKVIDIDLDLPEEKLYELGKKGIIDPETNESRGPLSLEPLYMKAIKAYFEKEGRKPTDIELETIAQTWSEHCKHTIFASQLDDIKEGIFKEYIKKSTKYIREKLGEKDFCISVFSDNSGGIIFDEDYMITDKAETHNSPSALDPFGGAITGIVGVNRDTMGFGMGALPIANKYGFCLGRPEDKEILYRGKDKKSPVLLPRRIMEGVIDGVNVGGNCSGIPTPTGFVYFDDDYKGKPLIFVGTLGLIPRTLPSGKPGHIKQAKPKDNIVMIGGRVGKDGIHGATFSSEALTEGSPATAVQIGDPITQKKLSDAVIKEARDSKLYNSITDNGAGGLSSSVGEMAEQSGGFILELDKVPLKYPGLAPWEIWISESQERMTLAIPDETLEEFQKLMERRGVESTVIGKFTDSGRAVINYKGKKIFDIDMEFLHEGLPKKTLTTRPFPYSTEEPKDDDILITEDGHNEILKKLLASHNICSYEFISRQYDHEVQANSVIKPLQGKGRVNGPASVIRPLQDSQKGVVMSQALLPRLSRINCYDMAACSIDTAIRNSVSVGGNIDHMALMDNFCWCSSDEPERLAQLKEAGKACYDYSTAYMTPLISGKDSMFNDFKGFDKDNNPVKISVPPTLMVSSTGVIEDIDKTTTMDLKFNGDLIYLIGETKDELGGSEFYNLFGYTGANSPKVDAKRARLLYQKMYELHNKQLLSACAPVNAGGIATTIAKMVIAGKLGAEINLEGIEDLPATKKMYSETQSRFIVTIDPKDKKDFEDSMKDFTIHEIGEVTEDNLKVSDMRILIDVPVKDLEDFYKERFGDY